jgi:nicotinate-nucleotide pyrophosphorylase (carboxylating)
MTDLTPRAVLPIIRQALAEDRAQQDITSRIVVPADQRLTARIVAKSSGIVAGIQIAILTFQTLDPSLRCRQHVRSGSKVRSGTAILTVQGRARSIFAAERTALNFVMHLSGIATLTRAFVDRARGTRAKILDTRKTLPGLRALAKYAVHAGGGRNHRVDLADAILIKTNQLRAVPEQTISHAIAEAKRVRPRRFVEIEVASMDEFQTALAAQPDAILLDNWLPAAIRNAVKLRRGRKPLLEVSGGVTLANVRALARTGVDRISIGRLTHSAPALDCSLKILDG